MFASLYVLSAFTATPASAVALRPVAPLTALYWCYSPGLNDYLLTTKPSEVASVCTLSGGYITSGILGYVEKTQQPNTLPFKRYWKGLPQTDHSYTTSASEVSYLETNGWIAQGNEGYIYTTSVPGSVPLYRLSKFNGVTWDLVHKFTTSWSEVNQLVSEGWGYDLIAGYLYSSGNPTVRGGHVLGLRCPTPGACYTVGNTCAVRSDCRDFYFSTISVPSTTKPTGTRTQKITFDFWSPDFFEAETGHIVFAAHGRLSLYTPDIERVCTSPTATTNCNWQRGAGFIMYGLDCATSACDATPQSLSELFWVGGANVFNPTYWRNTRFRNNHTYSAELSVSDDGLVNFQIREGATVLASFARSTASDFPANSPFPSDLTGYFLTPVSDSHKDYTLYVTNFKVTWTP